ncbi:MAG: M81 family metallopeptidase [Planctomycetota bacterium]|nr:M81 family metallopeptidase [Planctomycetota bacterium]
MNIAIAKFGQETSSFSRTRTTLKTFQKFGLLQGDAFREEGFQAGSIGGFIHAATESGIAWKPIPIIRGWAGASGPMTDEAFHFFVQHITDALADAEVLDGVFLDLHGAGQADSYPDSEGFLLQQCRKLIGPDVPLVLALDHHANLTQAMVDACDALVAHRTQPHHPADTGYQAGKLLFDILAGRLTPNLAWRKIPMLTHQEQFLTDPPGPMREWFEMARQMETLPGVVSASTFPMQPWLDVPHGGWAVAVVTHRDPELADRCAGELAQFAWDQRKRFLKLESVPPPQAIRRAIAARRGLVVLSDTGDSVFGGAPGDSTILLKEMLQQQITQVALLTMVDPEVVVLAMDAGVGASIDVHLGGKQDNLYSSPVRVTADVVAIGGGEIKADCIGMETFNAGRAVWLRIGSIQIVVSETEGIGGNHPAVYRHFGIEPQTAKMIVLKTASNFQYFADLASEIIRVNTPGMTMSNLSEFRWQQLPRPIYPLDPDTSFLNAPSSHGLN